MDVKICLTRHVTCFVGSHTSCGCHIHFMVRISGLHSRVGFAFVIHDTIGHGVTWDDVITNS